MNFENFDPLADLRALEKIKSGYVRDANCWHKTSSRQFVKTMKNTQLMCVTACGKNIGTTQIYPTPGDPAPLCEDCR